MTARFSRAAQQSIEFARKVRGHRPRLQLTEYRLNRTSSTSGVLKLGSYAEAVRNRHEHERTMAMVTKKASHRLLPQNAVRSSHSRTQGWINSAARRALGNCRFGWQGRRLACALGYVAGSRPSLASGPPSDSIGTRFAASLPSAGPP